MRRCRRWPGRCCPATASSSVVCWRARSAASRGVNWCVSIGCSRPGATSAAAASSAACRASSTRCPTPSIGLRELRRSGPDETLVTISGRRSAQSHRHRHARRPHSRRRGQPHRLPQWRAAHGDGGRHAAHAGRCGCHRAADAAAIARRPPSARVARVRREDLALNVLMHALWPRLSGWLSRSRDAGVAVICARSALSGAQRAGHAVDPGAKAAVVVVAVVCGRGCHGHTTTVGAGRLPRARWRS